MTSSFAQEKVIPNQEKKYTIQVGYFAPYGTQYGARIGTNILIKHWLEKTKRNENRSHTLSITPRIGYFVNPNIQKNYSLDANLVYRWYKQNHAIHPKIGLSAGYLNSLQNTDGTLSLSDGTITYNTRTLNSFIPTINIGFEKNRKTFIGYYISLFYGKKITAQEVNSAFFGAEIGISFNFKNKNDE